MKRFRIYVDTSVIGGCFDSEFQLHSNRLIKAVRDGKLIMLVSDILVKELENAPKEVRQILIGIPPENIERIEIDREIIELRNEYIKSSILSLRWIDDATHVAAATVYRADAIVSWNFKHIVRLDKMKKYNQINILNGYGVLTIISPKEVFWEDEG